MLSVINTSSIKLRTIITNIRSDSVNFPTFLTASAEIAKHIAYLFFGHQGWSWLPIQKEVPSLGVKRMISKGGYHGNDNRDGEKGYTLIQKEGKDYVNGVDLTDNLRAFNKQEYFKLPQAYCTMLHNLPERQKYKKNRTSDTSATNTTFQGLAQVNIGAIVNGVMQVSVSQGNSVLPKKYLYATFWWKSHSIISAT